MKKILILFMSIIFIGAMASSARAAIIVDMDDYAFNIDGTITGPFYDPIPLLPVVDISSFSEVTGLGSIIVRVDTEGDHFVAFFVDHDIDRATIGGYTNELGEAIFTVPLPIGEPGEQTWEIDEPGWGFGSYTGDIFLDNFIIGDLDNRVFYDAFEGESLTTPSDVSMALGWDFFLKDTETAVVVFDMSLDSLGTSIIFSSSLTLSLADDEVLVRGGIGEDFFHLKQFDVIPDPIPEPTTIALLGIGLAGLAGGAVRRKWKKQAVDKS